MDDRLLNRSEFLKLLALGGAGLAFFRANPEKAFAALAAQEEVRRARSRRSTRRL